MLGRTYDRENCSAARTLEIVGERWSLLIIRSAMFAGSTRFTEFQRTLGIAPNILSSRLDRFVEAGLMQTRALTGDHETREYVLTRKGLDLQPVIIALTEWGRPVGRAPWPADHLPARGPRRTDPPAPEL